MSDLFSYAAEHYPQVPGYQATDTSKAAANDMKSSQKTLQQMALSAIRGAGDYGFTAEELADALNVDFKAIQPRTTELKLDGFIKDSTKRRRNRSGKSAIVWTAVSSN